MSIEVDELNFFKHVSDLYMDDWKRVFKNKMAILMVLALLILPCFYAWFNIKALWDPYSNTGDLPVAVYSADKTQVLDLGKKKLDLNIGDEVVKNLKENHKIGWKFVDSKDELVDGVQSGKYYAGIYIPKDFSDCLMSFLRGKIEKPEIQYYVNQKINAIAPKITDKGAGTIQETITQQFIGTVSKAIFSMANKAGIDLDSHLIDVEKVRSLVLYTNDHLSEIDGYLQDVVQLDENMPKISENIEKTKDFVTATLPKVNQAAEGVVKVDEDYPKLVEDLSVLNTLPSKIPEIQNAGKQLSMLDQNFDKIVDTVDTAQKTTQIGQEVIQKAANILPAVDQTLNQANQFLDLTQDQVSAVQKALPQVVESIGISLSLVSNASKNIQNMSEHLYALVQGNALTDKDKADVNKFVQSMNQQLTQMNGMLSGMIGTLEQLQQAGGNHDLQSLIDTLKQAETVNKDLEGHLNKINQTVEHASVAEIQSALKQVNELSKKVQGMIQEVANANLPQKAMNIASELQATLKDAKSVTAKVKGVDLVPLLKNANKTLVEANGLITEFKKQLPSLRQEVHDASTLLNENMSTIIAGIEGGQKFYQEGLPLIGDKLNQASAFVTGALPNMEEKLQNLLNVVDAKLPSITSALNTTSAIINSEWPKLQQSIRKLAKKMEDGATKVDLKDIVKLLKNDVKEEVDFMKDPIKLKEENIYPVPNYGSQSAPFYTVLCLWVGGLLSSSLLSATPFFGPNRRRRKAMSKEERELEDANSRASSDTYYTLREGYVAKMLIFLTIAFIQAAAVTLGNFFILDIYAYNKVWYFFFALLVAFSFTSLIYMFVGLFKDVGKAACVIILVLSISGGGGNFPIQLSGPFFQAIYPFLPFTYGVNLIRESTGGIYWPNALHDILILALFAIVAIVLGIWLCERFEKPFEKIEEGIEKTHFFS